MIKKIIYMSLVSGLVLSFGSCYYDNEEELYPNSTQINDTTTVSYSATIAPMMASNCATSGCHVANGQSPNLTTYQGVFNSRSVVRARAVDGTPSFMPAAGPMSTTDRSALARWIDAGAPNN